MLQGVGRAFSALDRSLLCSPGDRSVVLSPPPVLGAAAYPGSPVLPERDPRPVKTMPPTSVLQLSPHVASPSLLSGLEAAEQRLEKYLVAKQDPPDPQTKSIQKVLVSPCFVAAGPLADPLAGPLDRPKEASEKRWLRARGSYGHAGRCWISARYWRGES